LYINDGTGSFTEMTGTPFEDVSYGSIAFADVDGDDDKDLLITGSTVGLGRISKLYTNDGTGSFTEMTGTPFEGVRDSSIAFADVDGDNDQDVLITGYTSPLRRISKLYTNDGTGSFTEMTGTPFEGVDNSSIAFADVDGDNDKDVLITGTGFRCSRLETVHQ
jgi:predicted nucleotidyltransferase